MVVRASSLKSLDDREVDIDLQFAQSPAKVICHSPARVPAAAARFLVFCLLFTGLYRRYQVLC